MNHIISQDTKTPRETIPFSRIKLEDFEPAIMKGIEEENEGINAIINNAETPTFENTIKPDTSRLLDYVTTIFFNLLSAHTSDAMDKLAEKLSPILTNHRNSILLNTKLFERIKHVFDNSKADLNMEDRMLLKNVYEGFERNGACLNEEDKKRYAEMQVELSRLTIQFSQNNLKETNAYQLHITDSNDLKGLPTTAIEAAAQAAKEKDLRGWLFTLHYPSYSPFMTYADNRELRKQMYMAKNTICCKDNEYDNREIVRKIVNLRLQIANILGYQTYADYVLEHRMAQDTKHVYNLIDHLLEVYLPVAKKEKEDVENLAKEIEGDGFDLQPWDWAYYSHKLKLRNFDLDAEMLRPYFSLERVKEGVFNLATTLYGITFKRNSNIEVYQQDVEAYEVFDKDGSFLAILYADFFPRESKQSGAWMTSYKEQFTDDDGVDHRPHVSLTTNFTKPTAKKTALLTLSEVETYLHEFGHTLHGMFSKVKYKSLGGTNVYWDFVELPSQIMENYAVEPEFLHTFAFHHETNEPIPDLLIEKIKKARNFQCGYQCVRQLSFCLLDMAYYTLTSPLTEDVLAFEKKAWKKAQLLPETDEACMSVQFGHIMSGGYSAGYYSYKWAEVLDADAFSFFQQNGIFDKMTANKFRDEVLSRGGTEPPMILYTRFRGQEPTIEALLKRNNIR